MHVFQVLKPGLFTTVQDMGRFGYLKYGVPISGAMDSFSLIAANLLTENSPNDACLEITLIGPELKALTKTYIAVTGGDATKNQWQKCSHVANITIARRRHNLLWQDEKRMPSIHLHKRRNKYAIDAWKQINICARRIWRRKRQTVESWRHN